MSLLLPENTDEFIHSCVETIEQVYSGRAILQDRPLENPDVEWFTDDSSYVKQGVREARYAIVDLTQETEVQALSSNTSSQEAELRDLTQLATRTLTPRMHIMFIKPL